MERYRRPKSIQNCPLSNSIVFLCIFSLSLSLSAFLDLVERSAKAKFKPKRYALNRNICSCDCDASNSKRRKKNPYAPMHMDRKCNKKCKSHLIYTFRGTIICCSGRSSYIAMLFYIYFFRFVCCCCCNFASSLETEPQNIPPNVCYNIFPGFVETVKCAGSKRFSNLIVCFCVWTAVEFPAQGGFKIIIISIFIFFFCCFKFNNYIFKNAATFWSTTEITARQAIIINTHSQLLLVRKWLRNRVRDVQRGRWREIEIQ